MPRLRPSTRMEPRFDPDKAERERRVATCRRGCPHYSAGERRTGIPPFLTETCKVCGCLIALKAWLGCPANKF